MTFKGSWWLQVEKMVEEEYCLIPMGGALPQRDQRIIGVGSTAGLVHPSTGYMVARALASVPQLADRIVDELASPLSETVPTGAARQPQVGRFVAAQLDTEGPDGKRTAPLHQLLPSLAQPHHQKARVPPTKSIFVGPMPWECIWGENAWCHDYSPGLEEMQAEMKKCKRRCICESPVPALNLAMCTAICEPYKPTFHLSVQSKQ